MEGKKIKNYKILQQLGQGAFGVVYKVQDEKDGQIYALKVMYTGKMSKAEYEAVKGEADIIKQLNHPSIVKYIDSFNEDQKMYIVLEYIDGGDLGMILDEAIEKGRKLSNKQLLAWSSQICLAINHIHGLNIIHRDLKPQNILITKNNLIKITDFGVSKQLASGLRKAKTCAGSRLYMAPEISQGKPYTKEVDLWSLGVILYELAALDEPFGSLADLAAGNVIPLPSDVTGEIREIIEGLLQKEPEKRMTTSEVLKKSCMQEAIKLFTGNMQDALKSIGVFLKTEDNKDPLTKFRGFLKELESNNLGLDSKGKVCSTNDRTAESGGVIKKMEEKPRKKIDYRKLMKYVSKYHPHPLTKSEKVDICCDVCQKEFDKTVTAYSCLECDFDLCESCRTKEKQAESAKEPKKEEKQETYQSRFHPHILTKSKGRELTCDICQKDIEETSFAFGCEKCDFDVCSGCIDKEKSGFFDKKPEKKEEKRQPVAIETFKSKNHEHVLYKEKKNDIVCDVCKAEFDLPVYCYHCEKCDFDMCANCKGKEENQAKAAAVKAGNLFQTKKHVHPLAKAIRDYNCDTCDAEFDNPSPSYHCERCDFDMCPKCFQKYKQ